MVGTSMALGVVTARAQEATPGTDSARALVAVDELSQVVGEPVTDAQGGLDECRWTLGDKLLPITVLTGDTLDPMQAWMRTGRRSRT
jgi:hypothetical protein